MRNYERLNCTHFKAATAEPASNMSDWDTVTVLRKRAPKASAMKSETAVNQARRQGVAVDTSQKCKPQQPLAILWSKL